MEQRCVQECGAQGDGERKGGEIFHSVFSVPVLRRHDWQLQGAFALQEVHLRGVQEAGAGGCQENRTEGGAPAISNLDPSPVERLVHLPASLTTRLYGINILCS
ncbi:gibberellin 2-beta-dioxygenase 8-like [Iris pallida]|uniref:Gibberellin 2-beta-dioxygenase 8-like n=1 Tax=Iris pallida TaxID=29817 RepID=A0AAX6F8N5_IRIPA|nr:gibberellin 2-beta-dioxygenase 8-like [Iris pallida]KAJ6812754.1 gibberellin 2-beta-dioxygenase 8-like [Iris pallida]